VEKEPRLRDLKTVTSTHYALLRHFAELVTEQEDAVEYPATRLMFEMFDYCKPDIFDLVNQSYRYLGAG